MDPGWRKGWDAPETWLATGLYLLLGVGVKNLTFYKLPINTRGPFI